MKTVRRQNHRFPLALMIWFDEFKNVLNFQLFLKLFQFLYQANLRPGEDSDLDVCINLTTNFERHSQFITKLNLYL